MNASAPSMATLGELHAMLPASRLVGDPGLQVLRVHSDTRSTAAGDLFVALRGERFDGHDHLAAAFGAGAVAALAERGLDAARAPGIEVADTLAALQQLAGAWRKRFAPALPLVAVTGSNGKTTVTQMVAAILRAWVGESATLATAGNLNNHIGVPLTLLRLRPAHRAAVLELGMNHEGEIDRLAHLAAPTVALVSNAQREHQEFMAGVEAVARENGQVLRALAEGGTAVLPAADAFLPLWRGMAAPHRVLSFGLDERADVQATASWDAAAAAWSLALRLPQGRVHTTLQQAGAHNVHNALAAAACAAAAGAPPEAVGAGLAAFRPVAGRSRTLAVRIGGQPATLVDDSYNANPDSVLAAVAMLAALPAPRWLVLGDMGEVGSQGPAFHAEVGAAARRAGIEHFWAAGALCAHAGAGRHFETVAALLDALAEGPPAAASVLVKGSRFMKMEQVVAALQQVAPSNRAAAGGH